MHFNPSGGKTEINPHLHSSEFTIKCILVSGLGYDSSQGRDPELKLFLSHSVGCHAVIILAVAASRPHQQSSGHHVEW